MITVKNVALTACIALSITTPLLTRAADLIVINNTNHYSTSIINGGPCSDILGQSGITHGHSTNVVPDKMISKACIFNKTNCQAEVHMTNNCSGPGIAIVTLDIKTGIKSVHSLDTREGYTVSGTGFTAFIDGGPAHKNWFQRILGL